MKYVPISIAAEKVGVLQSTLHYWQEQHPQKLRPRRARNGNRFYTQVDIDAALEIKKLRAEGYTHDGVKLRMKDWKRPRCK